MDFDVSPSIRRIDCCVDAAVLHIDPRRQFDDGTAVRLIRLGHGRGLDQNWPGRPAGFDVAWRRGLATEAQPYLIWPSGVMAVSHSNKHVVVDDGSNALDAVAIARVGDVEASVVRCRRAPVRHRRACCRRGHDEGQR